MQLTLNKREEYVVVAARIAIYNSEEFVLAEVVIVKDATVSEAVQRHTEAITKRFAKAKPEAFIQFYGLLGLASVSIRNSNVIGFNVNMVEPKEWANVGLTDKSLDGYFKIQEANFESIIASVKSQSLHYPHEPAKTKHHGE